MNFNLALIFTDGRFVDARAFRASCSSSPSGRSPHPASDSGALGVAFSLCWFRDTGLEPAHPALPGETQDAQKVGRSLGNAHSTVLRTPVIWEGAGAPELLGLDTRARTQVWIWTQMWQRYRDRHRCCNSFNTTVGP